MFKLTSWAWFVKRRIGDRRVIASVSGGKDSAAMSLYLTELGIEHTRVFADTGWEHDLTYEYLRGPLSAKLGPIVEVRSQRTLPELVRHKGMFPSRLRRWCTTELKIKPLAAFMRSFDEEVVDAIGIRAAESQARATSLTWEWSDTFNCEVWRSILGWSEDDVIAIHKRHGLAPNPLYLMGARRVGCWPCLFARKEEIRLMAETDPSRLGQLRALEADAAASAAARHAERGETFDSLGMPTFFSGTGPKGEWVSLPIDKAVAWSRTARGGRQLEMFRPEHDGCARWGLCEPALQTGVSAKPTRD